MPEQENRNRIEEQLVIHEALPFMGMETPDGETVDRDYDVIEVLRNIEYEGEVRGVEFHAEENEKFLSRPNGVEINLRVKRTNSGRISVIFGETKGAPRFAYQDTGTGIDYTQLGDDMIDYMDFVVNRKKREGQREKKQRQHAKAAEKLTAELSLSAVRPPVMVRGAQDGMVVQVAGLRPPQAKQVVDAVLSVLRS